MTIEPRLLLSRRQWLGVTAMGAMAAGSALQAADDPKGPWRMRLATSSIHFKRQTIEEACASIARLGFEGIDVWSAHEGCPHLDDLAKRLGPNGLKDVLVKNKLQLFAFSVYAGGYRRYAELLGQAGGGVAVRGSSGPCKPEELTIRMRAFLESLKPEVELADKYNSYLAIENHGHALLDGLDSFKAFTSLNKSPRLGLALAPYHLQAINASVEEAIAIAGSQLFFFYAWQRAKEVQQLPGHGSTDFRPWLAALARVNYRGHVNPFMHGDLPPADMSAALAKSRDYLLTCHAQAVRK